MPEVLRKHGRLQPGRLGFDSSRVCQRVPAAVTGDRPPQTLPVPSWTHDHIPTRTLRGETGGAGSQAVRRMTPATAPATPSITKPGSTEVHGKRFIHMNTPNASSATPSANPTATNTVSNTRLSMP